jgi:glycosyltransferase involved in cell wall biosynthesis
VRIAHLSVGDVFSAKWTASQALDGHDVHLITQEAPLEPPGPLVTCHRLRFPRPFGYCLNAWSLKRLLQRIRPDLLHVHYATGFGTLGRLSGFRPCVLSAWGSDVLHAPSQSRILRVMVNQNLKHYDCVCVTSRVMERAIRRLVPSLNSIVTPIGVDTRVFAPRDRSADAHLTVGTVKTMDPIYGIDYLLQAFAAVKKRLSDSHDDRTGDLRLSIVGGGPSLEEYRKLAGNLGIADVTTFHGQLPNAMVPNLLSGMDIFVALSRSESFGVAVVEASSCGIPVVASDVGGLPEVVKDKETGFVVPPGDIEKAADALERLICDRELRLNLGERGRAFVQQNFEWARCHEMMYGVYREAQARSGRTKIQIQVG